MCTKVAMLGWLFCFVICLLFNIMSELSLKKKKIRSTSYALDHVEQC